jgi:hypothetical protein
MGWHNLTIRDMLKTCHELLSHLDLLWYRAFVQRLLEDVWIAEAVHQDDADAMAGMCALERRHIVQFDGEADHFQTAFAIALWPERQEVSINRAELVDEQLDSRQGTDSRCHQAITVGRRSMQHA